MKQECNKCRKSFGISSEEIVFFEKMGPKIGNKKFSITRPQFCPKCRVQRRMVWRNDRHLYKRNCDISGKSLITMFSPQTQIKIIDKELWYSDTYDGRKYGKEFDFSRTFFEQFTELLATVPLPHIMIHSDENSLYTNYTYANKNCYLCFAGNYLEDSMYCYNAQNSRDCLDCLFVFDSELCYECIHSSKCYNVKFALHCNGCKDSTFLEECSNCSNCFMCSNLQNQEYCFQNKKYTKEEYEKIVAKFQLNDPEQLEELKKQWEKLRKNAKRPENHNIAAENCSGEYISNSKNCQDSYIVGHDCEDCRYLLNGFPGLKDSQDCTYSGENSSLMYECIASGADCYNMAFCNLCFVNCSNLYYCTATTSSKNCFGCVSVRNAEYCILNRQYTKDEYEEILPKIISHMKDTKEWGEFFPARLSPFGYDESLAYDIIPLTKEEIITDSDFHLKVEQRQETSATQQINASICQKCKKSFKTLPQELKFYEKSKIATPAKCIGCRHIKRLSKRNNFSSSKSQCTECKKDIYTNSPSEFANNILCKSCYQSKVF